MYKYTTLGINGEKRTVIVLSAIDWHFTWQGYQKRSKLFADNGFNVIYIESTAKRNPKLSDIPRIIKRFIYRKRVNLQGENPIPENLTVISPIMLPSTWRLFKSINRRLFINKFVRGLKERGIINPIVYCYLPTQTSLDIVNLLRPCRFIYHCVDNYGAFPGVPKEFVETEKKVIKSADLVFVTSDYLYKEKKKIRSDINQIFPAVDFTLFNSSDSKPLKKVESLCYFGTVCDRLDYNLIKKITEYFNGIKIKMVGPIVGKLPHLPDRVLFVGRKRYWDLPMELNDADCLIFPYKINEYTRGIIPAKLFESFATGKPVISTALPNFEKFKDLILVAHNHDEFLSFIESLLTIENEEKRLKRIEKAKENSWEKRFEEILGYIEGKQ